MTVIGDSRQSPDRDGITARAGLPVQGSPSTSKCPCRHYITRQTHASRTRSRTGPRQSQYGAEENRENSP